MDHAADEERGVGHAAGDDHIRTRRQRLDHRVRAEIGIGRDEAVSEFANQLAAFHKGQVRSGADDIEHIVAEHRRDLEPDKPSSLAISASVAPQPAGSPRPCS